MSEKPQLPVLNIDVDREAFVKHGGLELLRALDPSAKADWGMMTAQHMVEHLIYITENILGEREVQLITPEDKLPKYKAFLMGKLGFMQNFKFPLLPENELVPLKNESYEKAVSEFAGITDRLFGLLNNEGFETSLHPMYGPLNREQVIMFQFKHMTHHLMQFGLLTY